MSGIHAIAGTLRRFEHFRDRESPPSYSWLTGESWHLSFPLVLTAKTRPPGWDGEVPEPVAQIFELLLARLEAGLVLHPGTVVECGANTPWRGYPRALVCVPVNTIAGVPVEPDSLALVGLHAAEFEALVRIGKGRLLAHLGHFDETTGYGRTSSWVRSPLVDRFGLSVTELARIKTVRTPDWSCVTRRSGLTLRMQEPGDSRAAAEVANLKKGETVAFLLDPAWEVRSMPAWPPPPVEMERPAVLGAWSNAGEAGMGVQDGYSPAFLAVTLSDHEDQVTNLEDGLVLRLKASTLPKFAEALTKRQLFDHDLPDRTILRVRVVRVKSAPAKVDVKDLPCPERPAVPMPSPTFAPGERWHTFTTPFRRVYSGVKR